MKAFAFDSFDTLRFAEDTSLLGLVVTELLNVILLQLERSTKHSPFVEKPHLHYWE